VSLLLVRAARDSAAARALAALQSLRIDDPGARGGLRDLVAVLRAVVADAPWGRRPGRVAARYAGCA
jgi:hypothetical protein